MPRLNADITIWPLDAESKDDSVEFSRDEYDYLSFVNEGTYGIPPLITKTEGRNGEEKPPVAGEGESVLYVNPGGILAILVQKRESR